MEKRVNGQLGEYITKLKNDIKTKAVEISFDESGKINELLEYIYDYDRLILDKEDFVKRGRVKNSVPTSNRCTAKRANGEQCSRRKKEGFDFCGTHAKGVPHGLVVKDENENAASQKMEVFAQEICGIVYYIDKFSNVFDTEDIMNEKINPRIVAKYVIEQGKYSIPAFGI
jgi:hypothetical protein